MTPETGIQLRIATRGSPLALAQAHEAADRLRAAHTALADDAAIAFQTYRTTGDRLQTGTLAEAGGKGLFTKEIEQALLDTDADIAVHSMKDMPTELPAGLMIAAYLPRADFRDALIGGAQSLEDLPMGARVGTASLRRQAILKSLRPDLIIETLRGNVNTRLKRVAEGDFDATLLAAAGLTRLGMLNEASAILSPDEMLPAICQGIIGIECREDDQTTRQFLAAIDDRESRIAATAERAFLAALDGSCRTPIAGLARIEGENISLRGLIIRPDGSETLAAENAAPITEAAALGTALGGQLRDRAGPGFFDDG